MSVSATISAVAAAIATPPLTLSQTHPLTEEQRQRALAALPTIEKLVALFDDGVRIPIIGKRVGLDPIIGLIPVVGDLAGSAVSMYLIAQAARLGAPTPLLVRMIGRTAADLILGLIPLIGDLLDFFYRAHRGNLRDFTAWLTAAVGDTAVPSGALDEDVRPRATAPLQATA